MGHWYDKDANPRHYEGKNGGDTTLREARKLHLYPSVTTITSITAKDALTYWLQEQAALSTAEYLREYSVPEEIDKNFLRARIAEARAKVEKKADIGSQIHNILETYIADPFTVAPEYRELCYAIEECIRENTGLSLYDFISEETFCNEEWGYGGTCDLHTNESIKLPWVIDYKTKDEVTEKTRGYDGQAEQLAAYSHGLGIPEARIANIFIPRELPEGKVFVKFYEHDDNHAWQRFKHQCMLWQMTKKYGPYYERTFK